MAMKFKGVDFIGFDSLLNDDERLDKAALRGAGGYKGRLHPLH